MTEDFELVQKIKMYGKNSDYVKLYNKYNGLIRKYFYKLFRSLKNKEIYSYREDYFQDAFIAMTTAIKFIDLDKYPNPDRFWFNKRFGYILSKLNAKYFDSFVKNKFKVSALDDDFDSVCLSKEDIRLSYCEKLALTLPKIENFISEKAKTILYKYAEGYSLEEIRKEMNKKYVGSVFVYFSKLQKKVKKLGL